MNTSTLRKIIRLPDDVFKNVKIETIILIHQRRRERTEKENCEVLIYPRKAKITSINKEDCEQVNYFNQGIWNVDKKVINISVSSSTNKLLTKIEKETKPLIKICDFSLGLTPYDKYKGHTEKQIKNKVFHSFKKKDKTFKPLLSGGDITRYWIDWDEKNYISYGNWLGAPRKKRFFTEPRMVVRQIVSGKPPRIYAGYTEEEFYNTQIAFNILPKDIKIITIKYVLAILNSKLINFYHRQKYLDPTKNLFQKILIANAKKFPIKIVALNKQKEISSLVDKIILLNKKFKEFGDKKTNERIKIEEDIKNIDYEIDQEVYKLYNITPEEQKIIEESF